MKIIIAYLVLIISFNIFADDLIYITREDGSNFPRCIAMNDNHNFFIKWKNHALSRDVFIVESTQDCMVWDEVIGSEDVKWEKLDEENLKAIPSEIQFELKQIEMKANVLRKEQTAKEFIENRQLKRLSVKAGRELAEKYGQVFAGQVFKELN